MTFVLFLNAPVGLLEFTVDGVTAQCDKNFEGFKGFPAGIHFISYRYSKGSDTGASTCLILECPSDSTPVLVFTWDKETEQFTLTDSQPNASENILKYPHLAAYSTFMGQEGLLKRQNWTRNLSTSVLEACLHSCKLESIVPVYEITPMDESHHSLMQNKDHNGKKRLSFTEIPTLKQFSASATPEQVTMAACDRSVILESMKKPFTAWLGELELSFLMLVIGHNFEGFEQWIDILGLLAGSISFAQAHPAEYSQLFRLLRVQFEFCPDDFFNGLLADNKLFLMLGNLISAIQPTPEVQDFCTFFETKFGIPLDSFEMDEFGEFAPVIVE